MLLIELFFFSSRRRHTRCALVTGVQTCALPIYRGLRRVVQAAASVATASRHGPITPNLATAHLVDDDLVERHVVGIARPVFVGDHVVALDDAIGNLAMQPGRRFEHRLVLLAPGLQARCPATDSPYANPPARAVGGDKTEAG